MLDFEEKIELPDEMKSKFFNELQTLDNLWNGMCFVNELTGKIEKKANKKIMNKTFFKNISPKIEKTFEGEEIRYVSYGRPPEFAGLDKGLLYSLFQWYAISACNYVLLVGYLAKQLNPEQQEPKTYVEKVIPEVKWFRDKIAAHPVRTSKDNDNRDNEAERRASVLYQIGFDSEIERFQAPVWQVAVDMKGQQITSKNPEPWSITETHEMLVSRYKHKKSPA